MSRSSLRPGTEALVMTHASNLTGNVYVNQSAAYSDYHATGANPAATASYTDIAVRIGAPKAVRAVAKACATNHIAVAIPCHRVVRGGCCPF